MQKHYTLLGFLKYLQSTFPFWFIFLHVTVSSQHIAAPFFQGKTTRGVLLLDAHACPLLPAPDKTEHW